MMMEERYRQSSSRGAPTIHRPRGACHARGPTQRRYPLNIEKLSQPEQIAWAAGLFEGEGSMHVRGTLGQRGNAVQLRLGMTDHDVVRRFGAIMGVGRFQLYAPRSTREKPILVWYLYRASDVARVLESLVEYFGVRRTAKALEVMERARQTGPHNARKTHCPKGHLLSGENLIQRRDTIKRQLADGTIKTYSVWHRRCRVCYTAQERNRRRRERGTDPANYRV
jgi:hypothetical protein